MPPPVAVDVVIVGAGVAGLAAAEALRHSELKIRLLEKSPSPGGRLITRDENSARLDASAQFFTARSPEFKALLAAWSGRPASANWVKSWFEKTDEQGQVESVFCAREGMGGLMAHWAVTHEVACGSEVADLLPSPEGWQVVVRRSVFSGPTLFTARAVILTAPWPEAAPLVNPWLHTLDESERQRLQGIRYAPCLGLELVLEGNPQVSPPGLVFMPNTEVACVADQGAKGLRGGQGGLVMLCSPEYSERRFNESNENLLPDLLALAQPWLGPVAIKSVRISRWHHARVTQAFGSPYLAWPTPAPLVLCGDGFTGPRIEAAFTSGWQAGVEVKRILGGNRAN